MAGTICADTLQDGAGNSTAMDNAIYGSAKAWCKWQGGNGNTAGTILGSYNVSSVTVNGTGDYTVNFTNGLSNANYAAIANAWNGGTGSGQLGRAATAYYNSVASTTQCRVATYITSSITIENELWVSLIIID